MSYSYNPPPTPPSQTLIPADKDSGVAFLLELVGGLFGLLGLGYFYVGRTTDGIIRLVGWLVFLSLFGCVALVLAFTVVGILCIPIPWILVPVWSALNLKNQMEGKPGIWPLNRATSTLYGPSLAPSAPAMTYAPPPATPLAPVWKPPAHSDADPNLSLPPAASPQASDRPDASNETVVLNPPVNLPGPAQVQTPPNRPDETVLIPPSGDRLSESEAKQSPQSDETVVLSTGETLILKPDDTLVLKSTDETVPPAAEPPTAQTAPEPPKEESADTPPNAGETDASSDSGLEGKAG